MNSLIVLVSPVWEQVSACLHASPFLLNFTPHCWGVHHRANAFSNCKPFFIQSLFCYNFLWSSSSHTSEVKRFIFRGLTELHWKKNQMTAVCLFWFSSFPSPPPHFPFSPPSFLLPFFFFMRIWHLVLCNVAFYITSAVVFTHLDRSARETANWE